ncbi:non-ribosomal peptide synthetase [Arthrobacter sp. H35-D1]|uniref:non-ribosomal peptide synthetase n=1 Tax=Arthrobacter sp. H35-D1 TaxID=3046202 RepID=UPI0024BBCAC8|nr:non-ribosomal peptide synthetase [Arthrobacter sp. H35-D1]MDJ0314395.1 amino acid adenylation domain-containing protein [Arthrobacter sp. H35-D1]
MSSFHTGARRSLTTAQRGVWYAQNLDPENPMYQIAQFVDVQGDLDAGLMRRAVETAVAETDALNVRFAEDDDGPHQLISPSRVQLEVTDLRTLEQNTCTAGAQARALMDDDLATARNVATDPLLRVELFQVEDHRYYFYQRVHHLMLDGYSAVLVLKRIAAIYNELLANDSGVPDDANTTERAKMAFPSLDALLLDEAGYEDSRNAESDKEFWQNALADAEPASGLAERPTGIATALVRLSAPLPRDIVAALDAGTASAPALIVAAMAIYLHKMTAERHVSVALPVTARRGALAKSVPSMLSNIVPVRLEVSPEDTVRDTIVNAGRAVRNAMIHQRFRSEGLATRPGYIGPSINILPIVDGINFGPSTGCMNILSTGPIDDLSMVIHGLQPGRRNAVETADDAGVVTIQFEANSQLYSREAVMNHLHRFTRLLGKITSAPGTTVAALTLTTPEEEQELLAQGGAESTDLPAHTVAEEFEAHAAANPTARALVAADGELSFAELDQKSNQLAHYLRRRGARPGESVAVRLGRTTGLGVAILAILKSGAAYVPIDPDYPERRVQGMLEDAAPLLLLTSTDDADSQLTHHISGHVREVALDSATMAATLAELPSHRPETAVASQHDLAYVIFTSGSTGRPKAVGVEHRALLNLYSSHCEDIFRPAEARLGRTLRVAHTAGLSFDASWDPILWLMAGHELHLVDDLTRRDPQALAGYLAEQQIDSIETTPSFAKALLAEKLFDGGAHPSVVALGGEAVDPELWGALAQIPGVTAYNFYGPTETTVDSMTAIMEPGTAPHLGSSVANSRHYILDSGLNPVPGNAIGELYVAGHNVARGYLDQPELSSERFIADPFASDGSRMYRTGDVVRRLDNTGVEFLGRIDQQVKIRGFRIELSEIEQVLRGTPGVDRAAVVVSKNRAGYDQLLGYITSGDEVDVAAIRGAIRQSLPDYMVPSAIVRIPQIPLTANGKLDTKALPEPTTSSISVAPHNDAERTVAAAFSEVLGLDGVGRDDDFFELGGHSLLATRLVAVLRAKLGSAPALRTVFEFPTVAGIAATLDAPVAEPRPLVRQKRPSPLPLSPAQRRLWFLNRFDPTSGAYNIPIVLRLSGQLDVAALEDAVNDVVARHESLHTVFAFTGGEPEQHIIPVGEARVPLSAVQTTAEHLDRVVRAESARGFDVTTELPLRAALFQLSAREHVLLLTLHHIAADGWSLGPLARDLSTAYSARLGNTCPDFTPLPVQYADYALWQRAELGSEDDSESPLSRQLAFWKAELDGAPEELALPFDHARGTRTAPWDSAAVPVSIGAETHERLSDLAREHNASLFMVLQAAFAALLTKLGAGTDIPIGTPVAGRPDTALDDLVGFFVNTLVLRTDTSNNPTAGELIDTVRYANLRAYANQDAPFQRVVEELKPARSRDRHPLFQVMLTLANSAPEQLSMPGLVTTADRTAEPGGAKFDLLLDLAEEGAGSGLRGSLSFDPALFAPESAALIAQRFLHMVEQFVGNPHRPLSKLSVATEEESAHAEALGQGPVVANGQSTVLDEFADTAARHPARMAVSDGTATLTFAELLDAVELLAAGLIASGVQPGERVAVALPRTNNVVCATLAVLRAGAVHVPVDLTYPAERKALILDDSAPALTITASNLEVLRAAGRQASATAALAELTVKTTDQAYVVYTSGSTGTPKGVAVGHAALANLYFQHRNTIYADTFGNASLDTDDGGGPAVAHVAGLGFDAAWDPMLWLVAGATLHMVDDDIRTDAEALVEFCATQAVTVLESTPSHVRALLLSGLLDTPRSAPLVLVLGGESVPAELWDDLAGNEGVAAYNFYGPTEFTVDSVLTRITGPVANIGRAVRNVESHVLDDYLVAVPQGIAGELYLAGAGMAAGYVNRTAETASHFVANPHLDGARMYRTGDLVRQLPGGELQFVARADEQLKIRGFRVEPGEIESVIAAHEQVRRAAVVVESGATGRIICYYVGDASSDELMRFASRRLPDYMMPKALVALAEIPLTSHGKLDKRALPAPAISGSGSREPRTEQEVKVCAAFGTVLGVDEVHVDDDFFELGGHSLLAVALIAKLRESFGTELPLRAVFESPTPAALLELLSATADAGATAGATDLAGQAPGTSVDAWAKVNKNHRPDRIPLSYAQSRLWFLNQLDPGSSDYNIALAVRLTGELNPEALAHALDDLVARHEVLRTTYPAQGGTPEQLIHPASGVTGLLSFQDVTSQEQLARLLSDQAARGFDVALELPLRATLFGIDDDEWVLQLVVHHIASDGASLAPLARDISTAYSARCSGARPLQRALGLQYADFALWQRQVLEGMPQSGSAAGGSAENGSAENGSAGDPTVEPALHAKLTSWKETLAGAPPELALPTDGTRDPGARQPGGQQSFTLGKETTAALVRLASSERASLFMALHATLGGFLSRVGAGSDLVIGSPTAGRSDPALTELIGFFVNTVPIRLDVAGNPSFRELLGTARRSVLDAFDHDDVPFERLVEALNPHRELGRHPLFQTMLAVETSARATVELPGVHAVAEPESATGEAKFDLSFTFRELGPEQGLAATLDYNAAMFSSHAVGALIERFEAFAALAVQEPDHAISTLDILSADEIDALVAATTGPVVLTPAPPLLEVLAETVARQPDDTAVVCGSQSLSFAALDAATSQVAGALLGSGIQAGELVSVYLPRSLHTVVAALGVLRAGAVYNPIDADYPADRVAAILEDAGAVAVISTEALEPALNSGLATAGMVGTTVLQMEDLPAPSPADQHPAQQGEQALRGADELAYVMFTSGSTGRPKGVEISLGALANLLASHRGTLFPPAVERTVQGPVRVAHTTGVGFDASWDPMLWMVDGHELHLVTDEVRLDPQRLAGYFAEHGIGAWETTPGYVRQLLAEPAFSTMLDERAANGRPPLRLALGGEAFDTALWDELASRSSLRAWNLYGPTESTVDSLVASVPRAADSRTAPSTGQPVLGIPTRNSRAYILDGYLQHVPAGVGGELYLSGPQLARGYRGRPDLTSERFVADPFAAAGDRMYRTGDLVTRSAGGELVFQGRNDHQVKIRGFRVELGEVEQALRAVPGVAAAAALVRGGDAGGGTGLPDTARLVAYVVPEPGHRADSADAAPLAVQELAGQARSQLRSMLPGYMVPAAVVVVERIPLTLNGKVDAAALPDPAGQDRSAGLAPRTPREKAVAQIFEDVLSLPRVGIDESFFELGGHSFLAQPLISKVNDALGTDLPVQALFRSPSVEQLLAEASKGKQENVADSLRQLLPLRTTGSKAPLFAVHPATGVSWGYAAMLRRLDKARPLIGLQMPGMLPGRDQGLRAQTLTELADDYIGQLQEVQPEGPYHLLGWSFGGNLAHRLATRLQELGHQVAFLGILDAFPTRQDSNADIGTGPALWANYLHAAGFPVPAHEAASLDGARVLEVLQENHNPLGSIPLESLNAMVANFSVLAGMIRENAVGVFDGGMHVFRATEDVPAGAPTSSSWEPFVNGPISETTVPARHSAMLSESALDHILPMLAIQLGQGTE